MAASTVAPNLCNCGEIRQADDIRPYKGFSLGSLGTVEASPRLTLLVSRQEVKF